VTPPVYRLLLTTHIMVSVGWLGVVFAKLVLGFRAMASDAPGVSDSLYAAMEMVNVAFPPAAVATLVTGVLLSLGTRWGVLRHYWVATKLALCLGVIVTGVAFVDRLVQRSVSAPSVRAVGEGTVLDVASVPATLLISLSEAHVLMLGAATVLSVYKPWGRIPLGRQEVARSSRGSRQETAGVRR
jgi:hypothetical protein